MQNMRAGRELDALVAEKVMGWTNTREQAFEVTRGQLVLIGVSPDGDDLAPVPEFSTDIGAAWSVVERMVRDGHNVELKYTANGWQCVVEWHFEESPFALADEAPLAICRAALRMLG